MMQILNSLNHLVAAIDFGAASTGFDESIPQQQQPSGYQQATKEKAR
jgi:hypothetical protein